MQYLPLLCAMLNESMHERHVGVPYEFRMFRSINVRHRSRGRQSLWAMLKIQWRKMYHFDLPCHGHWTRAYFQSVPLIAQAFSFASRRREKRYRLGFPGGLRGPMRETIVPQIICILSRDNVLEIRQLASLMPPRFVQLLPRDSFPLLIRARRISVVYIMQLFLFFFPFLNKALDIVFA